jgi:uncharacterized membrane protein
MIIFKWVLGIAMVLIGITHFTSPRGFIKIVPKWLPAPAALVAISGVFEILGGVGLLIPATQVIAAWGLIALYVAVFPANINMAVNNIQVSKKPIPKWVAWARLPLQAVLIWCAWLYT